MEELFDKIIESLSLSDNDREALRKNRGFPDAVIDKMKFKSCGPSSVNNSWIGRISNELYDALKSPNIVIPYFDPDGRIKHIRPHKFGIKNVPNQIYIPYPYLGQDLSTVLVAESEFKALASCLLGVPAIGIPGISSFSKARFNEVPDTLAALGASKVIICFDNEIKDNPNLKNFKPDYTSRYDTQFYSYIMGYLLEKKGFDTTISVLNPDWMVDGKVDIDGILAKGIEPAEYKLNVLNGIKSSAYRSSWKFPSAHKSFMERRIARFFYEGPIYEKFNCYYLKGNKDKPDVKISNFVVKVIQTLYNHNGQAERLCKFYSNYGDSKAMLMTPDMMTSKGAFQKFCYEVGDYEFTGGEADLQKIWGYIFMNQTGKTITKLRHYGYNEESGIWFFGNGAYQGDQYFKADEESVVWIHDTGYKMLESLTELDAPTLAEKETVNVDLKDILKHLSNVLPPHHAKLVLGWALGNFFMPEILAKWGIYPFLFLYGKQASGKSTLANWLSAFFGFSQKGVNFHSSSMVGITRVTSQMGMVPVWLEEYRNKDQDIGRKNNFLRGIHDRSTIVKGTRKEDEIKTYKARSTLIISGEEYPRDAALNSRCLMLALNRDPKKQDSTESYEWLQKYKSCFNSIGHKLMMNRRKLWPKIEATITEYASAFVKDSMAVEDRLKIQMSILGGVCDALIGDSDEFSIFMGDIAENQQLRVNHEQALYVFFEDIYHMTVNGKIKNKVIGNREINGSEQALFWMSAAYAEWEIHFKGLRNDIPASKTALMEHLKTEPYFIDSQQARIGGKSVHAQVLDFNHPKFPEALKMLIVANQEADNAKSFMDRTY